MQEEQAVLTFFAQAENLPLALSVAEQTDQLRAQMNTRFWLDAIQHLLAYARQHGLDWQFAATEDRNTPETLVGLHCAPDTEQTLYLRPMMEQQNMGKGLQIYFGLMWSSAPTPEQLAFPAVAALRTALAEGGYKHNENFIAWQWTTLYPREKRFLLRYAQNPATIFAELEAQFGKLLLKHREEIACANAALAAAPRSMTISLEQLRNKRHN